MMNSANINNYTHDYANLYGESYDDSIEIANYKWYNDNHKLDKIGINPDGTQLIHDSLLYTLKKFKKIEKKINNINTIQLIYKLDNKLNTINTQNTKDQYFTDLIFGEKSNYVTFVYFSGLGKMTFSHIIFNGKMFN